MPLTLTVLRCPPSVAPEVRQVTGGEFSIGRGSENNWVLPDPDKHLSKRHCVIAFRQGIWQVAGTSTNGTFINREEAPLESGAPRTLEDGDRLILGVYEIEVRLVEEAQQSWGRSAPAAARKSDPFSNPFEDDPFAPRPFMSPPVTPAVAGPDLSGFSSRLPAEFDPLLPDDDAAFAGPTRADHAPATSDAMHLPSPRTVLPDDWDLDDLMPAAPQQTPAASPQSGRAPVAQPSWDAPAQAGRTALPEADWASPAEAVARAPQQSPRTDPFVPPAVERPAADERSTYQAPLAPAAPPAVVSAPVASPTAAVAPSAGQASDLIAAFLRGAGVENVVLPDPVQTMEQLGAAFRAVVSGIRHALIARSEVKREFRIEATVIRRRGNNLLKFSANDEDALAGLIGAGRRTDMGAEEAITDALTDIRLHELATMTAMQSAVRALVQRLGPDQIRDAKDQGGGMALLGNRKARAWDAYEALHAEVLRGLSDDFDSLFGKRFALAYEQAMQELVARQKAHGDDRR